MRGYAIALQRGDRVVVFQWPWGTVLTTRLPGRDQP
jgi:hypothetical protein